MVVSLPAAIAYLYPAAQPGLDWSVSDDGTGPKLTYWSAALGAPPTQAALDGVTQGQIDTREANRTPERTALRKGATAALATDDAFLAMTPSQQASGELAQTVALTRQMIQIIQFVVKVPG